MFFHHVPPKMPGGFRREVTMTTVIGLFSGVHSLVYFQTASLSAQIVALITLERLLSSMLSLVYFQLITLNA